MQASDAADHIADLIDNRDGVTTTEEHFRGRAAVLIALMAMILAIATMGGDNAGKDSIQSNILATDAYAFYQAKNVRQTTFNLAADALELEMGANTATLSAEVRQAYQKKIEQYRATAARYESEPNPEEPENVLKGEGKKELLARARHYEAQREEAITRGNNFDYSQALLQIAIVIMSVAILTVRRSLFVLSLILGVLGVLFMLNGFLLLVTLPF
jgi:hypothetical protein